MVQTSSGNGGEIVTLYRALEDACGSKPWRIQQAERTIEADELLAQADRFAACLGLTRGSRICLQVDKSIEAVAVYIACLRAGAVLVPLNTDYVGQELAYLIDDADPDVIICRPQDQHSMVSLAGDRIVYTLSADGQGTLLSIPAAEPGPVTDLRGDEPAAMIYTSGTTGKPKGAVLTHDNLLSNARALIGTWGINPADRLIHALPIYHVHGLFVALNPLMLAGATVVILQRFTPQDVVDAMPSATLLMGVPTYYSRLLEVPDLRAKAHGMRLFISGAAPLSAEIHRRFMDHSGHAVLERYGMSETGMISSNPLSKERRPGTVGFPLPEVEVRIIDPDTGTLLPTGAIGSIEVRGPNVFAGYWRAPEKTAQSMRAGFFVTGDLGFFDDDGYLQLVGRSKDLIITGGLNVYPAEVEAVLDALPGIAESAVIGVPHADFGEAVVAVVATPRHAVGVLTEATILGALSNKLARFKCPKRVIFIEALPRNAMGKVTKATLRNAYRNICRET